MNLNILKAQISIELSYRHILHDPNKRTAVGNWLNKYKDVPIDEIAALFFLAKEGNLQNWKIRLRLEKFTGKQLLWCLGLFVLSFLLTGLLIPSAKYLASLDFLAPPDFLPDVLNPKKAVPGQGLTTFMGVPLKGAY